MELLFYSEPTFLWKSTRSLDAANGCRETKGPDKNPGNVVGMRILDDDWSRDTRDCPPVLDNDEWTQWILSMENTVLRCPGEEFHKCAIKIIDLNRT